MSIRIGCDNLVYAIMTTEDTKDTAPVYANPASLPGVMHININPNPSNETCFADDGPSETAATLGKIEVEILKASLSSPEKAALLGHAIDSKGGLIASGNDVSPIVAIGFRTLKSNGSYRYVWLYKGRFSEPEDNNETRGESINFQNDTISAQFSKLDYQITVGGKQRQAWKYEIDEDDDAANATTVSNWFTAVTLPTAQVQTP